MTDEQKDRLRITIGMLLIITISIISYVFIPFIWVYSITVLISIIGMLYDYFTKDTKQGFIIDVLKWIFLVPVLNMVPLLIIPVFGVVNLLF